MLFSTRKILLGFIFSLMLLPIMVFASTEFKGTETVNINKANASTLAAYLKGIGANKAEAIVKYRKANGNFKSTSDLTNVPGVGDATFKDIKSKVSTSRGKSTAPEGYKLGESSGKTTSSKKKSSSKKSTSSTAKKSSSSKSASSKDKKTSDTKSTSSKTKKDSKAKKSSTSKSKSTAKKESSAKKSTAKKTATSKKKPVKKKKTTSKKKKTVKCKTGYKKVDGKCKAK